MAKISFYRMTQNDLATVSEIENESFSAAWTLKDFQEIINYNNVLPLVAKAEENFVAYVLLGFSENIVTILKFVIAPEFRRRGLGKTILPGVLNFIKQQKNFTTARLHVNTKNFAAVHLYEICGFKIIERLKNYYKKNNEDAFLMERQI